MPYFAWSGEFSAEECCIKVIGPPYHKSVLPWLKVHITYGAAYDMNAFMSAVKVL